LGAFYFAFQIYCDFSGYSDIAIGTSKLFGFEIMSNFRFPYFSRNIGEFWRRWHISLSTWFRDYLYIPLGGSKEGKWKSLRNILIIFIISGLWHGANWTFIFWGLFHSILFIPSFIFKTNRKHIGSTIGEYSFLPSSKEFVQVAKTFCLVTIGWVFFRSETVGDAFSFLNQMIFEIDIPKSNRRILPYIAFFILIDYFNRKNERNLFLFNKINRYITYIIMLYLIYATIGNQEQFIYFAF